MNKKVDDFLVLLCVPLRLRVMQLFFFYLFYYYDVKMHSSPNDQTKVSYSSSWMWFYTNIITAEISQETTCLLKGIQDKISVA